MELIAGRYQVGEQIGTGGMGEVRAGHDVKLDRPVAIKLLRADLGEQPDIKARFESEARAAARITHPNVVGVFDTGEQDDGVPYIVMELLSGRSLADELEGGALEVQRVRRIALEILSALEESHHQGILHRDLKPANVLLAKDGTVKVADFGIAKMTEGMDITMAGTMIGTPSYLAPERVHGEPATAASDVYSVGVVLYELLTGRRPYEADTPLALLHAIQNEEPPPLAELRPDVDPDLAAAVTKAMAKDPAMRYPDARSMLEDLGVEPASEVLDSTKVLEEPAMATEVSASPRHEVTREISTPARSRWRRLSRRNQIGVAIGAVVLALLLLSMLPDRTAVQTPVSEQTTETSVERPASLEDALDRLEEVVQP
jgi:eukaryotic-like serine/threonine-protein kinase